MFRTVLFDLQDLRLMTKFRPVTLFDYVTNLLGHY